jgi:hypothetical protein
VQARELRRQAKPVVLLGPSGPFPLDRRRSASGLPTSSRPCHLNGAAYGQNGEILLTLFHQGQILAVNRDNRAEIRYSGLLNPHGLAAGPEGGYIATDTHRGRFLSFSPDFVLLREIDFSALPGVVPSMENAGEWLQCVTAGGENIYVAADIRRSAVHLVDVAQGRYRTLSVPQTWGIQMIMRAPVGLSAVGAAQRILLNCQS